MGNLGSLYVQGKRKETICPVVSLSRTLKMPTEGRPPKRARPAAAGPQYSVPLSLIPLSPFIW